MNSKRRNFNRTLSVIVISALLTACSNPDADFKSAQQTNTEQAYQEFIKKHQDSPLAAQAEAALEKLSYDNAKTKRTPQAFRDFLKRFPKSALTKQAQVEMETVEYEVATKEDTIESYETFLKRFPDSKFKVEVDKRLEPQLEERDWNQALIKHTVKAYDDFWVAHPTATHFQVFRAASPADGFSIRMSDLQFAGYEGTGWALHSIGELSAIGTGSEIRGNTLTLATSAILTNGGINTPHFGFIKIDSSSPGSMPPGQAISTEMTDESAVRIRAALQAKATQLRGTSESQ